MRRSVVIWLIASYAYLAAGGAVVADSHKTPAEGKPVLELYTSQGCSSCPPADALLGRYAARGDVIALTLPVDYWDYLGWKDTLASPIYTERQKAYAGVMEAGEVYTPQIVIDGTFHVVGSRQAAVDQALRVTRKRRQADKVTLKMWAEDDALIIEAGAAPEGAKRKKGTVWLALVTKEISVVIERGENRGRTISYYNVVREFTPVGKWEGKAITLKLPKNHLMRHGSDGCTVLLQADNSGPILAAAELKDW